MMSMNTEGDVGLRFPRKMQQFLKSFLENVTFNEI
jgi:hypothetical protein